MFGNVESFYRPGDVREALRLLQSGKGQARIIAGGTDLVAAGDGSVRILIDITHAGLRYIRRKGKGLMIGATTTMADLEESPVVQELWDGLLARAAAACGSIQIRNMATVGGNLANGSPAADLATALLALDATVVLAGARGRRRVPVAGYLTGANRPNYSVLVEVVMADPPVSRSRGWSFQKFGRTAVDIALVNVAAGLGFDTRGRVKWARIALGAVAPWPVRAAEAETLLLGRPLDRALLAEAGAAVSRAIQPISDVRASADYRRELARVLTCRAIEDCAGHAGCSL